MATLRVSFEYRRADGTRRGVGHFLSVQLPEDWASRSFYSTVQAAIFEATEPSRAHWGDAQPVILSACIFF